MSMYYAHTGTRADRSDWQPLRNHLANVAQLAEQFAGEACPGNESLISAAKLAGWLHDLGKYRQGFQSMLDCRFNSRPLAVSREQTFHKQAGTAKAATAGHAPVAFAIAGHHGGMPDRAELVNLVRSTRLAPDANEIWPTAIADCPNLADLAIDHSGPLDDASAEMLTRVVFSCLVDADWTDTSRHERSNNALPPEPGPPALDAAGRLDSLLAFILGKARVCKDPIIAKVRDDVLRACLAASATKPGLFSLTVPTGGGKTLSSLAFALKHAAANQLRRVIYVAPYLSILDQNAAVLREALGLKRWDLDLFEHHSLAEPYGGEDEEETLREAAARRAENWDAPLVVTTNVQFFESLFSNRPSRCRKLHNIARSVILLDECQSLPPGLAAPTCGMLRQVAETLGASIVLCTATQPAFDHERLKENERLRATEIIPDELELFSRLKRVSISWPTRENPPLTWAQVADEMVTTRQPGGDRCAALCVVNTRVAARNVFGELTQRVGIAAYHLSTTMCPAHRIATLDAVRERLEKGEPCYLISTQLIEAGVDVDFPFVMREMGPLEAVIQAGGRCNREGLLNLPDGSPGGQVVVFRSEDGGIPSDHWYKAGRAILDAALAAENPPRIDEPADIREYFTRLYHSGELDARDILNKRLQGAFAEVARLYSLIDDDSLPVVVATWREHEAEIETLLDNVRADSSRANFRRVIPYQVNLRRHELAKLGGSVVPLDERLSLLVWRGDYDQNLGVIGASNDGLLCF